MLIDFIEKNIKKIFIPETIWWIGIFVFTILIHSSHNLNADEGVVLSIAWEIFNGKELYRDIFEFVAPGSFYLIAYTWKIFGVSYLSAKCTAIIAIFLSAYGIAKISFELTKKKSACIIALFFIISTIYWPLISYHTFNLVFLIWGIYFSLKALENKKMVYFALSGACLGLATVFLQHIGLYIFAGIAFFFLILAIKEKGLTRFKQLLIFSMSVVFWIFLLFLKWSPVLLFKNLIVFPLVNYKEIIMVPHALIYIFLLFLAFIVCLLRKEKKVEYYFIYYIQFILLVSAATLADHFHVTKFLFPIYALIPVILINSAKIQNAIFYFLIKIVLVCLASIIILPPFIYIYDYPLFFSIKNHDVISRAAKLCADSDYIYSGPFMPNFYFELRKKNISQHFWLITNHHTEKQFNEVLEGLKKFQPKCAILSYKLVKKYSYDQNNLIDNYILNNYNYIESINSISFYQKKYELPTPANK